MKARLAILFPVLLLIGGGAAAASGSPSPQPPAGAESVSKDDVRPVPQADKPASSTRTASGIAGGFVFVPIDPYRTWDTRELGDRTPLPAGFVERFSVRSDISDQVRIPPEAVAVTYNLTVTETQGPGFLAIYPADIDWPGTSAINWTAAGVTAANGGTVAIGNFDNVVGGVEIFAANVPTSTTHYVLDITGYYI